MSRFYNIVEEYESTYFQMPRWLYEVEPYKTELKGKNDVRVAYMFLLDRLDYSRKNGWIDDDGNLYFIYTNKELANIIGCSERQISRIKNKLIDLKLLIVKKQGFKFTRNAAGKIVKKENLASHLYLARPELDASKVYKVIKQNEAKNSSGSANLSSPVEATSSKDLSGSANLADPFKAASNKGLSGKDKLSSYLEKDSLDTNKIHEDTQLDFSPANYSKKELIAQNRDLVKNASTFMTETDNSEKYILSASTTKLLSMWCRTPKQMNRAVRVILNARNAAITELVDNRNYDTTQIKAILTISGQDQDNASHSDEYLDALNESIAKQQKGIENTLRKIMNSIRTKYGTNKQIKNTENYMFGSFKNYFVDYAEKELNSVN